MPHRAQPDHPRSLLDLSDAEILRECKTHAYRASGPGGQHRNKTSSAIRLHHGPTGLIITATESRSQHENKARALKRLREAVAIQFRRTAPETIKWPDASVISGGRLHVSRRNPHRLHILGLVLDVVAIHGGRLRESADQLGVTSSSLTSFLADHPKAWAEANRIRSDAGLAALKKR